MKKKKKKRTLKNGQDVIGEKKSVIKCCLEKWMRKYAL